MTVEALSDRRQRHAQREAVEIALPDDENAALLRMRNGRVLVFTEREDWWRPVDLRAVVLPDGQIQA